MGCLRHREIFYIIANSSLLLLGHTYFKSESRLRSWQRSWPCWNQWLFYSGIQLGQAFISGIFPWTCLFSTLFLQSVVFLFLLLFSPSVPLKILWKLTFFVEQFTINLLLSSISSYYSFKTKTYKLFTAADKIKSSSLSFFTLQWQVRLCTFMSFLNISLL